MRIASPFLKKVFIFLRFVEMGVISNKISCISGIALYYDSMREFSKYDI